MIFSFPIALFLLCGATDATADPNPGAALILKVEGRELLDIDPSS